MYLLVRFLIPLGFCIPAHQAKIAQGRELVGLPTESPEEPRKIFPPDQWWDGKDGSFRLRVDGSCTVPATLKTVQSCGTGKGTSVPGSAAFSPSLATQGLPVPEAAAWHVFSRECSGCCALTGYSAHYPEHLLSECILIFQCISRFTRSCSSLLLSSEESLFFFLKTGKSQSAEQFLWHCPTC